LAIVSSFLLANRFQKKHSSGSRSSWSPKMSTRIQRQIVRSNEDALAAFVQKKAKIDAVLTRLQALSDDHFGYAPDDMTWGHVGTLEH